MTYPTAIERAFELAKSGRYSNVNQIREQLRAEGFEAAQISGPSLLRQLRELIESALEEE